MRMETLWVSTIRSHWVKVNTGRVRSPGGLAAARPGMAIDTLFRIRMRGDKLGGFDGVDVRRAHFHPCGLFL